MEFPHSRPMRQDLPHVSQSRGTVPLSFAPTSICYSSKPSPCLLVGSFKGHVQTLSLEDFKITSSVFLSPSPIRSIVQVADMWYVWASQHEVGVFSTSRRQIQFCTFAPPVFQAKDGIGLEGRDFACNAVRFLWTDDSRWKTERELGLEDLNPRRDEEFKNHPTVVAASFSDALCFVEVGVRREPDRTDDALGFVMRMLGKAYHAPHPVTSLCSFRSRGQGFIVGGLMDGSILLCQGGEQGPRFLQRICQHVAPIRSVCTIGNNSRTPLLLSGGVPEDLVDTKDRAFVWVLATPPESSSDRSLLCLGQIDGIRGVVNCLLPMAGFPHHVLVGGRGRIQIADLRSLDVVLERRIPRPTEVSTFPGLEPEGILESDCHGIVEDICQWSNGFASILPSGLAMWSCFPGVTLESRRIRDLEEEVARLRAQSTVTPVELSMERDGIDDGKIRLEHFLVPEADVHMDKSPFADGATSQVYAGTWCGIPIAAKLFKRTTPDFRDVFLTECLMGLRYQHPNFVRVFGFCDTTMEGHHIREEEEEIGEALLEPQRPPRLLIIMERMTMSLEDYVYLRKNVDAKTFTIGHKFDLLRQAAIAVAFLHSHHCFRVLHRDIKARNFLVSGSREEHNVQVKICDFGLAKEKKTDTLESRGQTLFVGTRYWMAPEVLRQTGSSKGVYGTPADVWSFAMMIYEVLHGCMPFNSIHDETFYDVETQRCHVTPENLLTHLDPPTKPGGVNPDTSRPSLKLLDFHCRLFADLLRRMWNRGPGTPFMGMDQVVQWFDENAPVLSEQFAVSHPGVSREASLFDPFNDELQCCLECHHCVDSAKMQLDAQRGRIRTEDVFSSLSSNFSIHSENV